MRTPGNLIPTARNVVVVMQECADLLGQGFSPDSNNATRAIGYRQGMEALLRWRAHPSSLTLPSIVSSRLPGSSVP